MESVVPKPSLLCINKYPITAACITESCQFPSFHCKDKQCKSCNENHSSCNSIQVQEFLNFLKQNYTQNRQGFIQCLQMEKILISLIKKSQQKLSKSVATAGLTKTSSLLLQNAFLNQDIRDVTSKDVFKLYNQISMKQSSDKTQEIYLFCRQSIKQIKQLIDHKQNILLKEGQNPFKLNSKLVSRQQDVDFIFTNLKNPKQLELLFRASQNEFSAFKFHQKCDKFENTLTIIGTQFNKTLAGFTPLKWNSGIGNVNDPSQQSFLLSIDLKKKMPVKDKKQTAIHCDKRYGPTFGDQDIYISDKCDKSGLSANRLPSSYSYQGQLIQPQTICSKISGQGRGFNFKVNQYQVFHVIY